MHHFSIFKLFPALAVFALPVGATTPAYDHVVIVIEENHSFTQVIGNRTAAPYINQFADAGVNFPSVCAISHPSQPNYLEFFPGSNRDVIDDSRPRNPDNSSRFPFSTPNLGAALVATRRSFTTFSEDLPARRQHDRPSLRGENPRVRFARRGMEVLSRPPSSVMAAAWAPASAVSRTQRAGVGRAHTGNP